MAVTIITGTSTGIGFATAIVMGRAGHTVYATMRTPEKASELKRIVSQEKLPVHILALDVDNSDSVAHAIDRMLKEQGRIDVLVNNAGIGLLGHVEELPFAEFKKTMETNYFGALRCIQAVLPGMRKQRRGCIINVTSVAGRIATASQSPYAASKWALEGLSESLAQEVKMHGIRVAIVEPGIIQTPIFEKFTPTPTDSPYPHERRLKSLFDSSLQNPVSPYVVGEQIRQIAESDSWKLRYPVGPDSVPFLQWRAGMTDEAWVDWASVSDPEWIARVKKDFGLDIKL